MKTNLDGQRIQWLVNDTTGKIEVIVQGDERFNNYKYPVFDTRESALEFSLMIISERIKKIETWIHNQELPKKENRLIDLLNLELKKIIVTEDDEGAAWYSHIEGVIQKLKNKTMTENEAIEDLGMNIEFLENRHFKN